MEVFMKFKARLTTLMVGLAGVLVPLVAMAEEAVQAAAAPASVAPVLNTGDTAWMLISSALVLLMLPGLALFYGGMVRSKNVLSTMMHSFVAMGIVGVQWVVIGYTLSFGPDLGGGFLGGLSKAMFNG
jgi:Amt family ammonium transporter